MGALLSSIVGGGRATGIDFDAKEPQGDEEAARAVEAAEKALEDFEPSLQYLDKYTGNDALVRKAMQNPKEEAVRREAFEGMFPNVIAIRGFYYLAQTFDEAAVLLLRAALRCEQPTDAIAANTALLTRLARLFEAVFLFDWKKMTKPAVQNDFSFYRRELNKNANATNLPVDDAEASAISMFVAQSNPLLFSMSTALQGLGKTRPHTGRFLAEFVNACCATIPEYKKNAKSMQGGPDVQQTLVLAMVVGVALYDRVDATGNGAFAKGSPIEMKRVVQTIKGWEDEQRDSALSTLQYSTKTFNKAPSHIRRLFP